MDINESNFNEEVVDADIPVLVDFGATWCGPCRMMMPLVDKLAAEYNGRVKVCKVDTSENMSLANQYQVSAIPTFLFFKDGKIVERKSGVIAEAQMLKSLDSLL